MAEVVEQVKEIYIDANGQSIVTPSAVAEGVPALGQVKVIANVPSALAATLSVTENGTYTPETGSMYESVTVDVPQTELEEKSVTENGVYEAEDGKGYSKVTVDVPSDPTELAEKYTEGETAGKAAQLADDQAEVAAISPITENGTQTLLGESLVVEVPQTELEETSIDANGVYEAEEGKGYSKITVEVPSVEPNLEDKSVDITYAGDHTIYPTEGMDGMTSVSIYIPQRDYAVLKKSTSASAAYKLYYAEDGTLEDGVVTCVEDMSHTGGYSTGIMIDDSAAEQFTDAYKLATSTGEEYDKAGASCIQWYDANYYFTYERKDTSNDINIIKPDDTGFVSIPINAINFKYEEGDNYTIIQTDPTEYGTDTYIYVDIIPFISSIGYTVDDETLIPAKQRIGIEADYLRCQADSEWSDLIMFASPGDTITVNRTVGGVEYPTEITLPSCE